MPCIQPDRAKARLVNSIRQAYGGGANMEDEMELQLIFGYVLHVNGQPTSVGHSLEEAKASAIQYIASYATLQINSAVAPAPTQTWNYDYEIMQWVELIRG